MNRRVLALAVAAGLLLGGTGGYGDVEDLARLHFAWAEEVSSWFEGFAEAVDGQEITYHSHRDQSAQARIVRALDGEDFIEWRSAPIPAEWTGESATFVWVAGLGCNLGHKSFDLQVNGEPRFTFRTTYDRTWTVEGTGGGQLQFVAVQSDRSKDLFGYMKMTVPAAWLTPDFAEMRLRAFLSEELGFSGYVFSPGDFPRPQWKRPAMVFNEMGEFDLEVSFCDADMNPVETAEEPGRYGAVVEAVTPDGYQMQRYFTLFCCAEGWDWEARFGVEPEPFAPLGIPADVWQVHEDEIRDYLGWSIPERLNEKADGAVFWAGMSELAPTISPEVPEANVWYRDRQWWADFKRKQFGADEKYPALARPAKLATPRGNALREGDPASVGYSEESLDEIRKVCDEWAEVAEEPLAVLLAHKGVIVLHEAFGTKNDGQPMTLDTPRWMASITKLMTGCLMMQFVDQGLVGLDDPVSKYLPEFDDPPSVHAHRRIAPGAGLGRRLERVLREHARPLPATSRGSAGPGVHGERLCGRGEGDGACGRPRHPLSAPATAARSAGNDPHRGRGDGRRLRLSASGHGARRPDAAQPRQLRAMAVLLRTDLREDAARAHQQAAARSHRGRVGREELGHRCDPLQRARFRRQNHRAWRGFRRDPAG